MLPYKILREVRKDGDSPVVVLGLRLWRLGLMIKASPSLWYDKAGEGEGETRKYHLVRVGFDHCKNSYVAAKVILPFFVFLFGVSLDPTCEDCIHFDPVNRCTLDIRENRTYGIKFAYSCASFFDKLSKRVRVKA